MEPVFCTVKENGALPATELMIVGDVKVSDLPSAAMPSDAAPGVAATILQANVPTSMFCGGGD